MLGNDSTAQLLGRGHVYLKITSEKILILYKVPYALNIRRNLINRSLLISRRYKIILEFNRLVITRGIKFVEKGFVSEDLFKLSVIP